MLTTLVEAVALPDVLVRTPEDDDKDYKDCLDRLIPKIRQMLALSPDASDYQYAFG